MPVALEPLKVHVVWPRGGGWLTRGSGLGRAKGEKEEGPEEPPPHHHPPLPWIPLRCPGEHRDKFVVLVQYVLCIHCILVFNPDSSRALGTHEGQGAAATLGSSRGHQYFCWSGLVCTVGRADQEPGV